MNLQARLYRNINYYFNFNFNLLNIIYIYNIWYIVICGKCWFSSFIWRKRLQKVYEDAALSETTWCVIGSVASKTVISMLKTNRVKEGQKPSKTLMLFIMSCWNRTKSSLENGIERNWCVWAEHCAENGHNTSRDTKKWFYSMTTLGLTLPNPLKPTWKRSNGKFYSTRRIPQILHRPIITCSAHMKTSKNDLTRG